MQSGSPRWGVQGRRSWGSPSAWASSTVEDQLLEPRRGPWRHRSHGKVAWGSIASNIDSSMSGTLRSGSRHTPPHTHGNLERPWAQMGRNEER